ncbi:RidA family protein [Leucobacter sp.]
MTASTQPQQTQSDPAQSTPIVYASSLAIDVATMKLVPEADTIANETRVVFERISRQLEAAGLTLADVVKTTCYLSDESHREEFATAYDETFAPGPYPVNLTIVLGLAGDCRVQIEVAAAR